ncbi:DUF6522 family protein [Lutibaculum baratangense]|uniref:Uncharacterized protein n=1 Tax=Lutibaculum baratangense AMV1 TaxID=631454 RepID=V4RI00_9HYPH|nr:DUF6522 family protein [Lutibaculum baratangense]ESR25766.1 hypothetical protein N177_1599 [Lutibaculum baratangense AMV1]
MNDVSFTRDGVEVEASVLAEAFGLPPERIPVLMREGLITSRVERGLEEDEGRTRLTFFHRNARLRLVVGPDGQILRRSVLDYGAAGMPPAARRG